MKENDELISIFVKSAETAQKNMKKQLFNSKIVKHQSLFLIHYFLFFQLYGVTS